MIKRNSHPIEELELMAYLDGELSRERSAAAAAHLEGCAECRSLANDVRGVSKELAVWQVEPSDAQITARMSIALEDHELAKQKNMAHGGRIRLNIFRRWRKIWPWAMGAAALVFLAAVAIPIFMITNPAPTKPVAQHFVLAELAPVAPGLVTSRSGIGTAGKLDKQGSQTKATDLAIPTGPMIIRTAELALTTTDFDQARTQVEVILKRHDGYLGELNVTGTASSARTLTTTLRVPVDQLDATMAELKKLGRLESESQKGEEVSQQYVDLQARLLNARNSEQRLTELLRQRTGKLADVLEVEEQIESVRENIERMEAEKKNLEKQVAFSTVNMKVTEDYKERVHVVPDSTSTRLGNAAVEGYEMMVAGLINLLLFLASWGPSLLLWGAILFFPLRWLWRRRRRELF